MASSLTSIRHPAAGEEGGGNPRSPPWRHPGAGSCRLPRSPIPPRDPGSSTSRRDSRLEFVL